MFVFLTILQALVAAGLVTVILMQRSEGGGLGIGGSPSGMLSARGAADFLTRSTRWLAILFVALSIALAAMAADTGGSGIESTLDRTVIPADPLGGPVTGGPTTGGPVAPTGEALPAQSPAPVQAPANDDPLAE